jgi:hypothetical protein
VTGSVTQGRDHAADRKQSSEVVRDGSEVRARGPGRATTVDHIDERGDKRAVVPPHERGSWRQLQGEPTVHSRVRADKPGQSSCPLAGIQPEHLPFGPGAQFTPGQPLAAWFSLVCGVGYLAQPVA